MDMKEDKIFTRAGILFLLVGLVLIGFSIFYMAAYDKVEGELYVCKTGRNNRWQAYVTYEYKDVFYEDIGLSSYNGFTMKNGKNCTIYINPEKPEWPKVTNFATGTLSALLGIWVIWLCRNRTKSK